MSGRPGQDIAVTIHSDLWATGGLPARFRREILSVETQIRVTGERMTAEETGHVADYLHQLRLFLGHVEAARKAALRPSTAARDEESQGEVGNG